MVTINPVEVLLWTFRRNEEDVINLYDTLSSLMEISTGANMLNFGYWNDNTSEPYQAQLNLCKKIGEIGEFESAKYILDVGSGFSEPARIWQSKYPGLRIACSNINSSQLRFARDLIARQCNSDSHAKTSIDLVNCTSTMIPFARGSFDRVVALESAQHFRPLAGFVKESRRVLKDKGLLVVAIPIISKSIKPDIFKLGILSFTWSSEHYKFDTIKKSVVNNGFDIIETQFIGAEVFAPLAKYYVKNRESLKRKILQKYPRYVETLLFKSMQKMREVSDTRTIDYLLLKCAAE